MHFKQEPLPTSKRIKTLFLVRFQTSFVFSVHIKSLLATVRLVVRCVVCFGIIGDKPVQHTQRHGMTVISQTRQHHLKGRNALLEVIKQRIQKYLLLQIELFSFDDCQSSKEDLKQFNIVSKNLERETIGFSVKK